MVDLAREVTGRDIRATVGARRAGDPTSLVVNAEKTRHILGWTPRRGDLATQIADAWRWHQAYFTGSGGT